MSRFSARFFDFIQHAPVYQALHQRAVELLPPGQPGQRWLDVGCGAGLMTRQAAARGYQATGLDLDPFMVQHARQRAAQHGLAIDYAVQGIQPGGSLGRQAEVVSATSLLFVVPDKAEALRQLLASLAPGGTLLIVETTAHFQLPAVHHYLRQHGWGQRNWILRLWAATRAHKPALTPADFDLTGYQVTRHPLLEDWVEGWVIKKLANMLISK